MEPLWLRHGDDYVEEHSSRLAPGTKKRAEKHHRSLNKEIIATLKMTTEDGRAFDPADLEASVRRARALFRRPVTEREINAWKRAGRM